MAHRHAVWATPAPPVCTAGWSTREWTHFEDMCRPANYRGGRHDQDAWGSFVRTNDMLRAQAFYWGQFGIAPTGVVWC